MHIDKLDAQVDVLVAARAARAGSLPRGMPDAGVYLFSEGGQHLYVGRSNRIRQRIGNHTRPSSGHNQATFAFRLARQQTGKIDAVYSSSGSRQNLLDDAEFRAAFDEAKARVRAMDIRWIEEEDPIQQTLLEVYAAIRLGTSHNDFDTH